MLGTDLLVSPVSQGWGRAAPVGSKIPMILWGTIVNSLRFKHRDPPHQPRSSSEFCSLSPMHREGKGVWVEIENIIFPQEVSRVKSAHFPPELPQNGDPGVCSPAGTLESALSQLPLIYREGLGGAPLSRICSFPLVKGTRGPRGHLATLPGSGERRSRW